MVTWLLPDNSAGVILKINQTLVWLQQSPILSSTMSVVLLSPDNSSSKHVRYQLEEARLILREKTCEVLNGCSKHLCTNIIYISQEAVVVMKSSRLRAYTVSQHFEAFESTADREPHNTLLKHYH